MLHTADRHIKRLLTGLVMLLGMTGPVFYTEDVSGKGTTPATHSLSGEIGRCRYLLEDYYQRREVDDDYEYTNIPMKQVCPELFSALKQRSLSRYLGGNSHGDISFEYLEKLDALLLDRQRPARSSKRRVDTSHIAVILEKMEVEQSLPEQDSLVERIKAWFREFFGLDKKSKEDDSALIKWLRDFKLSKEAREYINYGLTGFIALLAIIIVWREMRMIERVKSVSGMTLDAGDADDAADPLLLLSLEQIGRLDHIARPPALFRRLVNDLYEQGWLSPDESRTNGELRAALRDADIARPFNTLLQAAEKALFGHHAPDNREIETLMTTYTMLNQRLRGIGT